MMIERATVLRYRNGWATVQCQAKAGCGGCSGQATCGTKSLSALAGEKVAPQFELAVEQPLSEGDIVEIGLAEKSVLISVFWLYCLPLMVVIASALILSQWIESELWVALGIVASTASAFMLIKRRMDRKEQTAFTPVFLRKV
ncbi:SoxR reducing system RseC family protein [Glaesserella sp.]|uniref:SoxR reducing system RseC family protein n=1 Tax=Glaesserella sp. TaxID=2094731 RepID=UPI0035A015D2